jgi:hypothetical protein
MRMDNGYLLELFSWRWGRNGAVEKWIVEIKANGVIMLEETVVCSVCKS